MTTRAEFVGGPKCGDVLECSGIPYEIRVAMPRPVGVWHYDEGPPKLVNPRIGTYRGSRFITDDGNRLYVWMGE